MAEIRVITSHRSADPEMPLFTQNLAKVKRNRTTIRTFDTYVLGVYGRLCRIVNAYERCKHDAQSERA